MSLATGDLIRERLPHLRSYARSLTRNPASADDLVQDTIVRVLTSIDRFDGSHFNSWSKTILHNRFIDDCRRARVRGSLIEGASVETLVQQPTQDTVSELEDTLAALGGLSSTHRKILTLICIKECTYERTAKLLKLPLGTVRSRLSRAREALLAALEGNRRGRSRGEARRGPRGVSTRRPLRSVAAKQISATKVAAQFQTASR